MGLVIGLVVFASLAVACVWLLDASNARQREVRLRRDLLRADASVAREHAKARQAMNDAAGQSWRNSFE